MAAAALSVPTSNAVRLADPALREALLKYARRRLPPGEVEDLVQTTLTEALISEHAPADPGDFQRWVHGIARHKIADSYRAGGRRASPTGTPEPTGSDPGLQTKELVQWIESELPKTDGAQATLHWLLRESDGESLDEIAREAALPAPRVRQRVSRLRRHFQERWVALGAASVGLLLVGSGLLVVLRHKSATEPASIAREAAVPVERAVALRRDALEQCAAGAYSACLAKLDQAKALDPGGESASAVAAARREAALAAAEPNLASPLTPSPSKRLAPVYEAPTKKTAPPQLGPLKARPKSIPAQKALPKKPRHVDFDEKQGPLKPIQKN